MKNAWMVRSGGGDYIELFETGIELDLASCVKKENVV